MTVLRVTALALVLAATLGAAGCGGEDEGSAEDWASSVCSNLNDWADEVDSAFESLSEEGLALDESDVRGAVDGVTEATDELVDDLDDLGAPESDSAGRARDELDALGDDLRGQLAAIERALEGEREPLEVVAAVTTALAAASTLLQETLDDLEGLDPAGELVAGFRNAEDCDTLRERIAGGGS